MSIGFVYILLNPAFPQQIKIGRTARDPQRRAGELSRQTGVPADFIVLYDELVGDADQVEKLLHNKFISYRLKKSKEFFKVAPKEAIRALQELALRFPVPSNTPVLTVDLLSHFTKYFSLHLDPKVIAIQFVQLPGLCYLEVTRQSDKEDLPITTREEVPLYGLSITSTPSLDDLRKNEALLRSCDEYDWIMISELFTLDAAERIGEEWNRPGGKFDQQRKNQDYDG